MLAWLVLLRGWYFVGPFTFLYKNWINQVGIPPFPFNRYLAWIRYVRGLALCVEANFDRPQSLFLSCYVHTCLEKFTIFLSVDQGGHRKGFEVFGGRTSPLFIPTLVAVV